MNKIIQNHPPVTSEYEKKFVNNCLKYDEIAVCGEYLGKFKKKFQKLLNQEFVSLVSNGTSAIHLSLIASGVRGGDEVLISIFYFHWIL